MKTSSLERLAKQSKISGFLFGEGNFTLTSNLLIEIEVVFVWSDAAFRERPLDELDGSGVEGVCADDVGAEDFASSCASGLGEARMGVPDGEEAFSASVGVVLEDIDAVEGAESDERFAFVVVVNGGEFAGEDFCEKVASSAGRFEECGAVVGA